MNVLTKNRILQEGDEFYDGKTWRPVPKVDYGLQIMFTKYSEVRRPSEEPPKNLNAVQPISPDSGLGMLRPSENTAKAEGEQVPCHGVAPVAGERLTETEKAIDKAKVIGGSQTGIKIQYPKASDCIWTGRNGTFKGYALEAMAFNGNVMLSPMGKRGVGNCTIQFPTAIIPQVVDWLLRQQK